MINAGELRYQIQIWKYSFTKSDTNQDIESSSLWKTVKAKVEHIPSEQTVVDGQIAILGGVKFTIRYNDREELVTHPTYYYIKWRDKEYYLDSVEVIEPKQGIIIQSFLRG